MLRPAQVVKPSMPPSQQASFPSQGSACLEVEHTVSFLKEVYGDFRRKVSQCELNDGLRPQVVETSHFLAVCTYRG